MSVEPVRRWCVGNVLFGKFWSLEIFLANFWKTLEVLSNFLETFETLKNFKKILEESLGNSLEAFTGQTESLKFGSVFRPNEKGQILCGCGAKAFEWKPNKLEGQPKREFS